MTDLRKSSYVRQILLRKLKTRDALALVVMDGDGYACLMHIQAAILVIVHRVLLPVIVWIWITLNYH